MLAAMGLLVLRDSQEPLAQAVALLEQRVFLEMTGLQELQV